MCASRAACISATYSLRARASLHGPLAWAAMFRSMPLPRSRLRPERMLATWSPMPSDASKRSFLMGYIERAHGPFGLDAQRGQTLRYQRTALVVIHTVTSGTRLADVVPLLEPDLRVQVVFTHAPSALISGGVHDYLDRLGGVVVPWQQATQTRFDL